MTMSSVLSRYLTIDLCMAIGVGRIRSIKPSQIEPGISYEICPHVEYGKKFRRKVGKDVPS